MEAWMQGEIDTAETIERLIAASRLRGGRAELIPWSQSLEDALMSRLDMTRYAFFFTRCEFSGSDWKVVLTRTVSVR